MFVFSLSMLCFFGYRWHAIRTSLTDGRLTPDELRSDLTTYLRGASKVYYAWLVGTLILLFGIILFYEIFSEHSLPVT